MEAVRQREKPPFSMFATMVEKLIEHVGEDRFSQLANDFYAMRADETAQMERIVTDPWLSKSWKPMVYNLEKDDDYASNFRLAGNKAFHAQNFGDAVRLYNTSVLLATHPDPSDSQKGRLLPVAYFNRAVALLQLGDYENALKDLQRAEDNGYPPSKKYRLLDRQSRALTKLRRYDDAKRVFENGLTYLETEDAADVPDTVKDVFKADWTARLNRIEQLSPSRRAKASSNRSPHDRRIAVHGKDNSTEDSSFATSPGQERPYAEISPTINLRYSQSRGRHFVAERDLEPGDMVIFCQLHPKSTDLMLSFLVSIIHGEIIVVERPYASVLDPDCWETHCLNCYNRTRLIVPCPNCCLVTFCSEECRGAATDRFHKTECGYIGNLLDDMLNCDKDNAALANRAVILAGLQKLRQTLPESLDENDSSLAKHVPDAETLKASPYSALFNLQSHTDCIRPDQMLRMGLQAYYMARLLQEQNYFDGSSSAGKSDDPKEKAIEVE